MKYRCSVCGYLYDEEKEERPFCELTACPVCKQPADQFELTEEPKSEEKAVEIPAETSDLAYDSAYVRNDPSCRYMKEIHQMAVSGKSISAAMGTQMPMPGWDDILLLGAQLNPAPLNDDDPVVTTTVIGKHAKRPMILENPVYVSHMSFGALSREVKIALAKGSAMAHSAMCSGEGGILPEEQAAAAKYIFEYIPNKYSVTDENLRNADAIEIKIGQGTKPGMGGHLPGDKVTPEIAALRGKKPGEDVQSPSKFPELKTKDDLKEMVDMLTLDLVEKRLVTEQIVLTIGYDIENLTDPDRRKNYKGQVTVDQYGRKIPKHAHGTVNLKKQTSSTYLITSAVMGLFDRITDPTLLVRRVNIVANHVVPEAMVSEQQTMEQLDLFTDYEALERKRKEEKEALQKERKMQEAMLSIKKKYGKNAILKGMNLQEGATAKNRNSQIGGHKA